LLKEESKRCAFQHTQTHATEGLTQGRISGERAELDAEATHVKGRRQGLPLLLESNGKLQEVMACYDTGTHDNHMSHAKAIEMGCTVVSSPELETRFQLPNGKVIKAIGQVDVQVRFARHVDSKATSVTCRFNVFENLSLPVLMGMTFLQATETITKYTSRLVDLPTTWKRSLRLCALGNATNQVSCIVDGRRVSAAADTGSDIALISGRYARKRRFLVEQSCEELELADGSLVYTSGSANLVLHVLDLNGWGKGTKTVRFHILEDLQFDVLLDETIVDALNIFQDGLATLISITSGVIPSIHPVIHLRSVETTVMQAGDKVSLRAKRLSTSLRLKCTSMFSKHMFSPSTATPGKNRSISSLLRLSDKLQRAQQFQTSRLRRGGSGKYLN
jgi:hypothetical protein